MKSVKAFKAIPYRRQKIRILNAWKQTFTISISGWHHNLIKSFVISEYRWLDDFLDTLHHPDSLNDDLFIKLKIRNKNDLLPNHTTFDDRGIGFDENIDSIDKYESKISDYMDSKDKRTIPDTINIIKLIINTLKILDEVAYRIIDKQGKSISKEKKDYLFSIKNWATDKKKAH